MDILDRHPAGLLAVGTLSLLMSAGCGGAGDGGDAALVADSRQTPPAVMPAATEEQARELGEKFVAAANAGDAAAVAALLDLGRMADDALAGLDLPAETRRQFEAGFTSKAPSMAGQYTAAAENGNLRLLGVSDLAGAPGAVVRMFPAAGGVGYIVLLPTPEGRVGDLYVFLIGERMSASLRRLAGLMLGGGAAGVAAGRDLLALSAAATGGDAEAGLAAYERLPDSFKEQRPVQIRRLAAAARLDDPNRYRTILEDMDRRFPDDPSLDLLKLVLYADDPKVCAAAALRLDAAFGGDAYLKGLAAEYLPDVGRTPEAAALAEAAVAAEPDLMQARAGLLAARIGAGDHAGAIAALRVLRDDFDLEYQRADFEDYYAGGDAFAASPEYAAFAAGD